MLEWDNNLKIEGLQLSLDSRTPCDICFVSHAHSDHLGSHAVAFGSPETARLSAHRLGTDTMTAYDYRIAHHLPAAGQFEFSLHPAGHVLGSAMIHVRKAEGTLLYTGDFKLRPSLTAELAEPVEADYLVMESTYGLPIFRFPPWRTVADQLVELCSAALRAGRQPIVMAYSLGKGQEVSRILADAHLPVTQHGATHSITQIYEQCGMPIGPVRRYKREDFHGPAALDLAERGVLVAPPNVARSSFVTSFDNPLRIVCTGWALLPGAIYRHGVDHALPLSDHADFDELLELIERVRPKKIFTHHGYRQFAETLRERGLDATLARPDPQLSLF